MNATLGVLESCLGVVERASLVRIDPSALEALAARLARGSFERPAWRKPPHWWDDGPATAQYVFVLDTLNFCFWGEPKWRIEYQRETLDGYWALAAGLRLAIERGDSILDPRWLRQASRQELRGVLAGSGDLPLLEERAAGLRQLGALLLARYAGQAANLVAAAGGSAVALAQRVAAELPSFDDRTSYQGAPVCFYKRAQILCSDLYGAYDGQGPGAFADLEVLTAFADYKLPQLLREFGVLAYQPSLAARVDNLRELAPSSPAEVEIRASTVVAVERLRQALAERGRHLAAFEIDWYLWELSQQTAWRHPYHRSRTIFY